MKSDITKKHALFFLFLFIFLVLLISGGGDNKVVLYSVIPVILITFLYNYRMFKKYSFFTFKIYLAYLIGYMVYIGFLYDPISIFEDNKQSFSYYHQSITFSLLYITEFFAVFLFALIGHRLLQSTQYTSIFINSFIAVGFLVSAYSIANFIFGTQYVFFEPMWPWTHNWNYYLSGQFSYKNHYSLFLLICLVFLHAIEKNIVHYFTYLPIVFVLINSGSRLYILVYILLILFMLCTQIKHRFIRGSVVIMLFSLSIVSVLVLFSNNEFVAWLMQKGFDSSGRLDMYHKALILFFDNILFGTGVDNYSLTRYLTMDVTSQNTEQYFWLHNEYLQILVTQGLIGFILFLNLTFTLLKVKNKNKLVNEACCPFLLIFIILALCSTIDYVISLFIYKFMFFVAALLITFKQKQ